MKTDQELFEAMAKGDQRAAAELYDRHFLAIRGYFINKVPDPSAGDDLVQETFTVVMVKAHAFRRESSFRAYLFGVAHNVLRAHYRKCASRIGSTEDIDDIKVAQLGPGVSTLVSHRAETQRLLQALRRIDVKYQSAFEMYYWQELTAKEIGQAIGIPEGTARSRLRLAKKALLEELDMHCGTFTELLGSLRSIAEWANEVHVQISER